MSTERNLIGIVRINEKIKLVVGLAYRINLLALNAMVLSRQAGEAALGFAVISSELRSFSRELADSMAALSALSFELVSLVSQGTRRLRSHERLNRALAGNGLYKTRLQQSGEAIKTAERSVAERFAQLHEHFDRAGLSARLGTIIARSLKIEATYGGGHEVMLAQVACEFDRYIDTIPRLLAELKQFLPPRALML